MEFGLDGGRRGHREVSGGAVESEGDFGGVETGVGDRETEEDAAEEAEVGLKVEVEVGERAEGGQGGALVKVNQKEELGGHLGDHR